MRFLLILLLMSFKLISFAQWTLMSQNNGFLGSLQVIDYDVIIATSNNDILKSYNGGITTTLTNINDTTLLDVFFCNDSIGYCTGSYGLIFKTYDGGNNWTKIYQSSSPRLNHTSINFIHPDTGWIVGHIWLQDEGVIFSTTDGGHCFNEVFLPERISSIHMFNSQHGFASTSQSNIPGYYQTENGGLSWEHVHNDMVGTWEFCFLNDSIGYALGTHFYSTQNGGNSWTFISYPIGLLYYMDLKMVNQNIGYLCGRGSNSPTHPLGIYKTMDGGESWAMQQPGIFSEIDMFSADTGYAVTTDGLIYKTVIGGIFVDKEEIPVESYNIYFNNGNLIWQTADFYGNFNLKIYSFIGNIIVDQDGFASKHSIVSIPITSSANEFYLVTITGDNNLSIGRKILFNHH